MTIGRSMINFPRQSIAAAVRAEIYGYAFMAEISEDDQDYEELSSYHVFIGLLSRLAVPQVFWTAHQGS